MRNIKGQITIFIIIGIVIMLFAFFFIALLTTINVQTTATPFDENILVDYLESCVADATNEALLLVGKQGGRLYTDQDGSDTKENAQFVQLDGEEQILNYGLIQSSFDPPKYPLFNDVLGLFPGQDYISRLQMDAEGTRLNFYWGRPSLKPLCALNGENKKFVDDSGVYLPCLQSTYAQINKPSIQSDLEKRITIKTNACITDTKDEIFQIDEIISKPGTAKVLLTDNDVRVTFNVFIEANISDAQIKLTEINHVAPVRLLRVHNYLAVALFEEGFKFDFDPVGDSITVRGCNYGSTTFCYDSDMLLSMREISPLLKVLTVEDEKSIINGESFKYQVLIPNRIPMLDKIGDGNEPIIAVSVGEKVVLRPYAFDADGDELEFMYGQVEAGMGVASEFVASLEYTTGIRCEGVKQKCASWTPDTTGTYKLRLQVLDQSREGDYQIITINVGP